MARPAAPKPLIKPVLDVMCVNMGRVIECEQDMRLMQVWLASDRIVQIVVTNVEGQ